MTLQNQSRVSFETEVSQQRVWPVNLLGHYKNSTYYFDLDIKLQFYVLFLSRKLLTHTFLLQIQSTHTFCCKNDLSTLVLLQKQFTHTFFVAKTIYLLRLESFWALKVAIRKVQIFWASGQNKYAGAKRKNKARRNQSQQWFYNI